MWTLEDNSLSHCALCVSGQQGEVVDIQYGSLDDLRRAKDAGNITNQIAVVKLGQAPLLYKVGGGQSQLRDTDSTHINGLHQHKDNPIQSNNHQRFTSITFMKNKLAIIKWLFEQTLSPIN